MESGLCKIKMNLVSGDRYHSLDNTDHSFVLSSQLSILPLIWAKFGQVYPAFVKNAKKGTFSERFASFTLCLEVFLLWQQTPPQQAFSFFQAQIPDSYQD